MTPDQFRAALNERGIARQIDAAAALRVSQETISRYLSGKHRIPGPVELALEGIPKKNGKATAKSRRGVRSKAG